MVSISNVDQIMVLVRSQLQRVARDKRQPSSEKADSAGEVHHTRRAPLETIRALRHVDDRSFDRLVVRALLIEEFGEALSDDPSFSQIADNTLAALEQDPHLKAELEQLRQSLRS